MFQVTADPTAAFADAVHVRLTADATLMALVTDVTGYLSQQARTAYPYAFLGRQGHQNDAGAMGLPGGTVSLQIDVWSDAAGPYEVSTIASRLYALLERQTLVVAGFSMIVGSLTREMQEIFDEPDPDTPDAILYHAVQRWTAMIEEAA